MAKKRHKKISEEAQEAIKDATVVQSAVATDQDHAPNACRHTESSRMLTHMFDFEPASGVSVNFTDKYDHAVTLTAGTSFFDDASTVDKLLSNALYKDSAVSELQKMGSAPVSMHMTVNKLPQDKSLPAKYCEQAVLGVKEDEIVGEFKAKLSVEEYRDNKPFSGTWDATFDVASGSAATSECPCNAKTVKPSYDAEIWRDQIAHDLGIERPFAAPVDSAFTKFDDLSLAEVEEVVYIIDEGVYYPVVVYDAFDLAPFDLVA